MNKYSPETTADNEPAAVLAQFLQTLSKSEKCVYRYPEEAYRVVSDGFESVKDVISRRRRTRVIDDGI